MAFQSFNNLKAAKTVNPIRSQCNQLSINHTKPKTNTNPHTKQSNTTNRICIEPFGLIFNFFFQFSKLTVSIKEKIKSLKPKKQKKKPKNRETEREKWVFTNLSDSRQRPRNRRRDLGCAEEND